MNEERINELKDKISCSVIIFPSVKDGNVEFSIRDIFVENDHSISFSGVASISQKECINEELELMLLRPSEQKDKIKTFSLAKINLNVDSDNKVREDAWLDDDEYKFKRFFRFDYKNIPSDGKGKYAVFLVLRDIEDEEESIVPINGYYFDVE